MDPKLAARKNSKIFMIGFSILLGVAIVHTAINALALYNSPETSLPWYSAFAFTGMMYLLPLLVLLAAWIVFARKAQGK